jgi:hypothetical protein
MLLFFMAKLFSGYRTLAKTFRVNGFFGGHIFRQFESILLLRELPGPVAGVYKWLSTPGRCRFGAFWGVLWLKTR